MSSGKIVFDYYRSNTVTPSTIHIIHHLKEGVFCLVYSPAGNQLPIQRPESLIIVSCLLWKNGQHEQKHRYSRPLVDSPAGRWLSSSHFSL